MTRFVFTKGSGKTDRLEVHRTNAPVEVITCPKQGIIPHDMVHFAVEHTLTTEGFLTRIAKGELADFRMTPSALSDSVERLVEVVQGDAWSGGNSTPADLIGLYQLTCGARSCAPLPLTGEDLDRIRRKVAELTADWSHLPVGGSLSLSLEGH